MTGPTDGDERFMALALSLGRRHLGRVWPNPSVGAVVVKDGRIVGRGATAPGGRPHAEVIALEQAGPAAEDATVYVSLEPCSHTGKSPPCTDALIAAKVARVVSAITDPDPRVAGSGHAKLRAAGIEVRENVLRDAAAEAHCGFFSRVEKGRPWVTLKLATSLDGRIATATGESRWITGSVARRLVHGLRHSHDGVLVGGGTARADDPSLTVRGYGDIAQPVRMVASRHLNVPIPSSLTRSAGAGPVWFLHGDVDGDLRPEQISELTSAGVELIPVAVAGGHSLDPLRLLQALAARGLTRVFCEGGGVFAASLLNAGLVDELWHFSAGVALGAEGQPALGAMGVDVLADAPRIRLVETRAVGGDTLGIWRQ